MTKTDEQEETEITEGIPVTGRMLVHVIEEK
jgi:hypothetical protein